MATIEKRNNAYRITVCCGYDINGKQIRRRMTYTPDEKMTAKQIEKEVQRHSRNPQAKEKTSPYFRACLI